MNAKPSLKILPACAILFSSLLLSSAHSAESVSTNWVTAAPEFREVDGKLYNTERSVKFQDLEGRCLEVFTNGILLQQTWMKPVYERIDRGPSFNDPATSGNFIGGGAAPRYYNRRIGEEEVKGNKVFIFNFTAAHSGQRLSLRAIPAGDTKIGNESFVAYDFGLPHVVPVLITNRPAIASKP